MEPPATHGRRSGVARGVADLDGVASFEGLQALLARLAAGVEDDDERSAVRRAVGTIGRLGKGVVDSELESLGEGIA